MNLSRIQEQGKALSIPIFQVEKSLHMVPELRGEEIADFF